MRTKQMCGVVTSRDTTVEQSGQAIVDEIVNELEDPEVPLNDFSRIDFRKKEKGFHCKLCRKSFDRLNTLKRHLGRN